MIDATYTVVRIRRGTRAEVAIGLSWTEAMTRAVVEEKAIKADPESRAVMSRTIVAIELEKPNQGASRHQPPRMTHSNEGSKP